MYLRIIIRNRGKIMASKLKWNCHLRIFRYNNHSHVFFSANLKLFEKFTKTLA